MNARKRIMTHWTAAIIAIAAAASSTFANELFSDGFSDPTLAQWNQLNGNIQTLTSDGAPPPCLLVDDYGSGGAYATTKQALHYVGQYLEISADMKADAFVQNQRYTNLALARLDMPGVGAAYIAQMSVSEDGRLDIQLLWDNAGTETTETAHVPLANPAGWHNGRMTIRRDGHVEFYLDGALKYTSLHAVTPLYDGQVGVEVGCRRSLYDNVRVIDDIGWKNVTPNPAGPSVRNAGTMVYDAARRETLLIMGYNESVTYGDMWYWKKRRLDRASGIRSEACASQRSRGGV